MRDAVCQNIHQAVLLKRDKAGAEGGKEVKLLDFQEKVLDIIGRDTPVLTGLNVRESLESKLTTLPCLTRRSIRLSLKKPV